MTLGNFESILVPIDFSKASFSAVGSALEFVDTPGKVTVIHVVPARQSEADYLREAFNPEGEIVRARAELEKNIKELGYRGVKVLVEEGVPGEIIASVAKKLEADLIVIPSHSRSGLPRLFLGSVANRILQLSECPVLVLKRSSTSSE